MGIEIERKFLVNKTKWQQLEKPAGEFYRQGYLLTDPNKTIRVRQTSDKGFLTIKGISVGATRAEYEYEIAVGEAKELLDQFSVAELSKIRFKISVGGHVWEVDEFLGNNAGLLVAEIELTSEDETFTLPDWIDSEVTGDEKYYNSNLVNDPYKDWQS
ncbi:CYTH domain-containing protein [Chryseobacterium gotjawalense]|uniref:CYTH domain-containing protein n=1 Tax=Chryseobacterium gotjawalense TaxID=3042315 RepID=A0ABY8RGI0_9FLAO|nr:CYTH domain-containing protein [Chryseobacterium sp. wdc7]WHF53090.1 CYTH domain-containing protein [Chryseobacterium sp. wdc7]